MRNAGRSLLQKRSRQTLVRAAGALAIAGWLITGAPRPVAAQGLNTPLRLNFTSMRCEIETGDNLGGFTFGVADEPYVVFWVGDYRGTSTVGKAFRTDVFQGVDGGETRSQTIGLWHPLGGAVPIEHRDGIILLAAVLEEDDNRAGIVHFRVQNDLNNRLASHRGQGLSHAAIVSLLKQDMEEAINSVRRGDDRIGPVLEIRPSDANLLDARSGRSITIEKFFFGSGSQGQYKLTFQLSR